jgi:hypothetical protein
MAVLQNGIILLFFSRVYDIADACLHAPVAMTCRKSNLYQIASDLVSEFS